MFLLSKFDCLPPAIVRCNFVFYVSGNEKSNGYTNLWNSSIGDLRLLKKLNKVHVYICDVTFCLVTLSQTVLVVL